MMIDLSEVVGWLGSGLEPLRAGGGATLGDFAFFKLILDALETKVSNFGGEVLKRVMTWVGVIGVKFMTLWLIMQGYRIMTGRSQASLAAVMSEAGWKALIVTAASAMSIFGDSLSGLLIVDLQGVISTLITGDHTLPAKQIDAALWQMQVALASIDAITVINDPVLSAEKQQAKFLIGFGTGGPAITAGAMLLLYQIAMSLFIGLGPLFILCLLFEQTKALFQKWLMYGIGTMFSMAVLSVMVGYALGIVIAVSKAFWVDTLASGLLLGGDAGTSYSSQALQQGGLGLILTVLIISAPPMAAMFFQGTLGSFVAHSQMDGSRSGALPTQAPAAIAATSQQRAAEAVEVHPQMVMPDASTRGALAGPAYEPGRLGIANRRNTQ